MVKKDAAWLKKQRLDQITKHIAKFFPEPVSLDAVVLWAMYEFGLREDTVRDYIDLTVRVHGWSIRDGMIHPPELE